MPGNFTSPTIDPPCIIFGICFFGSTVLLLPLFALVLYFGLRRWRIKNSLGKATISHSDFFTYNIIPMELSSVIGHGCNVFFMFTKLNVFITLTQVFLVIGINGQNLIHLITCVEHYVAVLHPVQYLRSKNPRNITIRNISFACLWTVLVSGSGLSAQYMNLQPFEIYIMAIPFLGAQFLFVVYCNFSILRSLTRRGPGVTQRDPVSVDLKKRRAFYTVTTVMVALLARFLGSFFQMACFLWMSNNCFVQGIFTWFGLPSSLVQPLLFLHRAGKLPFLQSIKSTR